MAGDYQTDEQVQADPIDTLYQVVHDRGLYTKSLDEFKRQYSSPDQINKLYGVVKDQGLYSKSSEEFSQKYFGATAIPKYDARSVVPQQTARESTAIPKATPQSLPSGTSDQQLVQRHQKAMGVLQQELLGNQDVIPDLIKKQKEIAGRDMRATDLAAMPRSDQPLTAAQQQLQQLQPNAPAPVTVSDQEVQDYHKLAQTDPTAGRAFLQHVAQTKPEKSKAIQEGLYLNDAMDRVENNPQKTNQVLLNAKKIAKGDLKYNGQSGVLIKPEGVFESIATGLQEKNKAFNDYDLFSNANSADAIKELEKRRNEHDPDQPIPVPENFGATMAGGMAGQPLKGLIAGKAVGGVTAMIPGAEEFAPATDKFIAAAVSGNDFRKLTYAHSLQQYYNQLRNEGQSPEDAYKTANGQAKDESMVDALGGAAMMYAGSKIGEIKLPSFNMSAGYTTALKTALKQGAQGIGEAGAVGLIQAAGQDVKNKLAEDKGIQVDHTGTSIGEAFKSGALFTLGMAALAKGMGTMSGKAQTGLMQYLSKAPKEAVNSELGNLLLEGHITPEEAQKAANAVDEHRTLDQSIPESVTDESRMKIQDKIKRRQYLEMQLESADKAFHPEIKEKIKAINEDILELSKDKKPRGQQDELSVEQSDVSRGNIENQSTNELKEGDEVTSPHFEGTQKIRSVSPDGQSVFIEGEKDHHVHEVPMSDVRRPGDITDEKSAMSIKPVSEKIEPTDALRTWDLGDMEGKPEDLASKKHLEGVVEKWDAKPATDATDPIKQGETFGQFVQRVIPAFDKILKDEPANTSVITHSSVLKAFKVWDEMGRPDISALTDEQKKHFATEFNKEETHNGDIETFKGDKGDIHVIRHGQTEDNAKNNFRSGDTNLTEKGKEQAAESGNQLGRQTGGDIPKIITSDLPRAVHTSNIIHDIVNPKTEDNATRLRSDQGQIREEGNAPERGQETRSNDLQQPPVETPEHGETEQQEGGKITGIAQRVQEQLGLRKYEKGEGWTPEEAFAFGKAAIAQGADPVKAMTDPAYANLDLGERLAIAQAHNYTLHNDIVKAENDFGIESDQYKDAVNKQDEYLKLVQKLKTESSRAFTAQQGQIGLDTGSFTSVKKAIEKKQGTAINEEQSAKVAELTQKNKDLSSKISALENRLKKETDESFGKAKEKPAPKVKKEKLSSKISDIAKRIRTSSEFDDFLKGPQGDVQKMGVDLPRLKEIAASILEDAAKAVKKGEDIAEFLKNAVDKIKEDIGDKDKFLEALHGIGEKTGLFDSKESQEEKKIKRLEKELSDLQQGIAKQKNPKSEDSDRAKQLKDQIKDERQKLGLTTSKSERPLSDEEKLLKSENDAKALAEKFVDKKGNKFTPEEASSLWGYMKENYLDKNVDFRDAIVQTSNDIGLSFGQISNAIVTPKTKRISDAMWKQRYDLEKNREATRRYVDSQGENSAISAFKKVADSVRETTVFGHGGIFVGTHAGMTLMDLPRAKYTVKAFFNAYKLAYGKDAYYQRAMEGLKSSKNYLLAQHSGLKNNPDIINNDAEIIKPLFGRISESGKRGFNAIKILRQNLFDAHYDALSVDEKADPNSAVAIAKLVNNATGASNLNIPDWVNEVTFAGGMEAARWGKLTRNPIIATKTALNALFNPKDATISDRVFAKVWAKRVGTELASYIGLLTLNAAIQSSLTDDPKKKVNLLDPTKSDWLKMKIGDTTFDFTSGMLSTLHFMESIAYQGITGEPVYKGESLTKSFAETGYKYGVGKLSPFYGDIIESATRHDYNGNTLPWSDAKPLHNYNHKMTWTEYIGSKLPLPVAEAFKTFYEQANEQGMDKSDIDNLLTGLKYMLISGGTGFKAYETKGEKQGGSGGGGGATNTYEIKEWK